jgi:hypothetical protein
MPIDVWNIDEMLIDRLNNIYLLTTHNNNGYYMFKGISKISAGGKLLWSFIDSSYNFQEFSNFWLTQNNDIIMAAGISNYTAGYDYYVSKFNVLTTKIDNPLATYPTHFALQEAFPNPFNPSTKITYSIPEKAFVVLKVFNILGQEIATLANEIQEPGNKSVEFLAGNLPSGVYFYRLIAGSYVETKKMILMK